MDIFIYIENVKLKLVLCYCLDFINGHPSTPKDIKFSISNSLESSSAVYTSTKIDEKKLFIPAQNLIFGKNIVNTNYLFLNAYSVKDSTLYSVERKKKEKTSFITQSSFGFDWMETIFFHLTRYEERHFDPSMRNQWDMMPEEKQILVRNNLHQTPVLDVLIPEILKSFGIQPVQFETIKTISHDIDYLFKPGGVSYHLRRVASIFKYTRSLKRAFTYMISKKSDVFEDTSFLDSGQSFNHKTIYFLLGGNHPFDVKISNKRSNEITKMANKAVNKGYTIGFHPSYLAATNDELYASELSALESLLNTKISTSRQHYLHFDILKTIAILQKNKISKDSSLGYNENVGFRCGTGVKFYLFDWINMTSSNIIEHPLVWMDSSQLYQSKRTRERFISLTQSFFKKNNNGTSIELNIHNSTWEDYRFYDIDLSQIYQLDVK